MMKLRIRQLTWKQWLLRFVVFGWFMYLAVTLGIMTSITIRVGFSWAYLVAILVTLGTFGLAYRYKKAWGGDKE